MLTIQQISKSQWDKYSVGAHYEVFGKYKPQERDRYDFVLVLTEGKQLVSYVTCREFDSETLYLQYGGVVPHYRGKSFGRQSQDLVIRWALNRYKRVCSRIENDNVKYMILALRAGFRVVGTLTIGGTVLADMLLEFNKGE